MMGSNGFWIPGLKMNDRSAIRDPKSSGACSSVWLERTPDKREVDGSTPSRPTIEGNGADGVFQLSKLIALRKRYWGV
jgi:hypothetical protein